MVNVSFAVLGKALLKMSVFMTSFPLESSGDLRFWFLPFLLITSYIVDSGRRSVEVILISFKTAGGESWKWLALTKVQKPNLLLKKNSLKLVPKDSLQSS